MDVVRAGRGRAASIAVACAFLAGCAVDVAIEPHVIVAVSPPDDVDDVVRYASAWAPLGFTFGVETAGRPSCTRAWAVEPRTPECEMLVRVAFLPHVVETFGADGAADRDARAVQVQDGLDAFRTAVVVAHELGHVILDTPEHYGDGIMAGQDDVLHDTDRELACRVAGVCD